MALSMSGSKYTTQLTDFFSDSPQFLDDKDSLFGPEPASVYEFKSEEATSKLDQEM